ncbi:MAG: ion transporter [Lachnospiraceae bacterium]|nr:ion transporter [Lachnospiraceae bacterium]
MKKSENEKLDLEKLRKRLFNMVSVGVIDDPINTGYDIISTAALVINLAMSFMMTFKTLNSYRGIFHRIEEVTVAFFALDFVLRLITAHCLYPDRSEKKAVFSYLFSGAGIIDLMSFLPYYLPFFFPTGAAVFRLFRVVRIFRLFRINAYYDSLNVITEVIYSKKQQLLSSFFILTVLMMASSLCMYSLEHDAQPDVFENAFSGIWWSVSTLLTVGYGDIYPITVGGKFMAIVIAFLGVGMVAIPTGIISAGFVEQYTRLKHLGDYGSEEDVNFIETELKPGDGWCGKQIKELFLPSDVLVAAVQRNQKTLIPKGNLTLNPRDRLIIGAPSLQKGQSLDLKEILLKRSHPWVGQNIRNLDISRQSFIVLIKRGKKSIIPQGNMKLRENDRILMIYKQKQVLP